MNSTHTPGQAWRLDRKFESVLVCAVIASNAVAGQCFIGNRGWFAQQQEKS